MEESQWPKLEQDFPSQAERVVVIPADDEDLPAWERPAAPAADRPPLAYAEDMDDRERDSEVDLLTPTSHRSMALHRITAQLLIAETAAMQAEEWAEAIGFHEDVRQLIRKSQDILDQAQRLLLVHEGR